VDNLISVNTARGIEAGNELLKRTSQVLKVFRGEDIVARVGGNKFAAILPLSDETIGENAIARLRSALSAQSQEDRNTPLLLSFGVATGQKGSNLSDLFIQAEKQISRSK
jgi:diguanylate cyclase (GGDEF)-like protein